MPKRHDNLSEVALNIIKGSKADTPENRKRIQVNNFHNNLALSMSLTFLKEHGILTAVNFLKVYLFRPEPDVYSLIQVLGIYTGHSGFRFVIDNPSHITEQERVRANELIAASFMGRRNLKALTGALMKLCGLGEKYHIRSFGKRVR